MAMKPEEKIRIMQLVQNGTITPEEALQLLEGMERKSDSGPEITGALATPADPPKWARILVSDMDSGKTKVNLRLPLGLITAGRKMGAKIPAKMNGMDLDDLFQGSNLDKPGQVLEVYDEEDREHVEIFVE